MKPSEYIEAAKKAQKVATDYALAKTIGINKARISDWQNGKSWPDAYACAKLAEAANLEPMKVLADIEAQREKNPAKAKFWRSILGKGERLILVLAMITSVNLFMTGDNQATPGAARGVINQINIHYRTFCIQRTGS